MGVVQIPQENKIYGWGRAGCSAGASWDGVASGLPFMADAHHQTQPQTNCDWSQCRESPSLGLLYDGCQYSFSTYYLLFSFFLFGEDVMRSNFDCVVLFIRRHAILFLIIVDLFPNCND